MTLRVLRDRGRLPRALALVAMSAVLSPTFAAANTPTTPKAGPIRASIEKIAVKEAPKSSSARRSEARGGAQSTPGQDRSFFKTGPGILALAVMVIGTGYAIYSTQNDRIKSPGKE